MSDWEIPHDLAMEAASLDAALIVRKFEQRAAYRFFPFSIGDVVTLELVPPNYPGLDLDTRHVLTGRITDPQYGFMRVMESDCHAEFINNEIGLGSFTALNTPAALAVVVTLRNTIVPGREAVFYSPDSAPVSGAEAGYSYTGEHYASLGIAGTRIFDIE